MYTLTVLLLGQNGTELSLRLSNSSDLNTILSVFSYQSNTLDSVTQFFKSKTVNFVSIKKIDIIDIKYIIDIILLL